MTPFLAVPGTWSWDGEPGPDEWQHPESDFHAWMREQGLSPLLPYPFVWSSCLDGILGRDLAWEAAAYQLTRLLDPLPLSWRNIVAHSHGGTVAVYAARDVAINRLVTVGMPVRKGTEQRGREALRAGQIGAWWHLHAEGGFWADVTAVLGGLFDGRLSARRWVKIPGVQNVAARGIGHSRVLREREHWSRVFVEGNVCAFLRGEIPTSRAEAV